MSTLITSKMIEAMGLKIIESGHLEWHYLRTKFHENILSGSEVIGGEHTDRQPHRQTATQTDW
jgi:hypothetical protein